MPGYLLILAAIIGLGTGAGWWAGQHQGKRQQELSLKAAASLVVLGLVWFLLARWARPHADTDRAGAELAEWFAHSGKWFILLGAGSFGHGMICGLRQIPPQRPRRLLYFVALLGLATLIVLRTAPVYVLLGDGERDAEGRVRESERLESTCGAVALLNYLEVYRHLPALTERELSRLCGVTREGSTTRGLLKAARHFGLTNATARVVPWNELEQQKLPLIVSISTLPQVHHATLLIKLDNQRAWFIDPAYGLWDTPREHFRKIWYGKTVLLE
ncbi:MAG: cysteine peptidase family C39 domain-containing protein [Verrucomicrobiota bacterium]